MDSCIGSNPGDWKQLLDEVTAYLESNDKGSSSSERMVGIRRAVSTTYHGVLFTEMSIGGATPKEADALDQALESLLSIRVPVFLLCTDALNKPLVKYTSIPPRFLIGYDNPDKLRGELASAGLKFPNLLIVTGGGSDQSQVVIKRLLQSFVINPGFSGDSQPIAFAATGDSANAAVDDGFLPVISNGKALDGRLAVAHLIKTLCFGRPLNLTEQAKSIQDASILKKLIRVGAAANQNFHTAGELIDKHRAQGPNAVLGISVYDPRSGAVYFRPHDWREALETKKSDTFVKHLLDYFDERLPDYWQEDRPCYRRILFTPTKVLLRGEQYYVNMRNESPFVRIRAMEEELTVLETLFRRLAPSLNDVKSEHGRKLVLAFLDQVRSITLQIFSFVHSAELLFSGPDRVPSRGVRVFQEVMDSGMAGMPVRRSRRTG